MIKKIKGDLLDLAEKGEFDYIAHGCNCFVAMGAGIARQIADKYPEALREDARTRKGDPKKLGDFSIARRFLPTPSLRGFWIVNAYTQYRPGADFQSCYLETFLHKFCLTYVNGRIPPNPLIRIGVPWIGCGIGGGNKASVMRIFNKFSELLDITIVEYAPKK